MQRNSFAPPFVLTVTTLSYKILCMAYICCARGWDSSTRYNISTNLGIKFLYQTQDFTNSFFQDWYLKLPWCTKLTYTHYMRVSHAETKSICGFNTVKNIFFIDNLCAHFLLSNINGVPKMVNLIVKLASKTSLFSSSQNGHLG